MKQILVFLIFSFNAFSFNSKVKCIAHRGLTKSAPANSLNAIKEAYFEGIDGVEFDIVHTFDEIPILNHDLKLKDKIYQGIGNYKCKLNKKISKYRFNTIINNCFFKQNKDSINSLEEVLSFLENKSIFVFIELKDRPTKVTEQLIFKYFQTNYQNLRIISFKQDYIDHLKNLNPRNDQFWQKVKFLKLSFLGPFFKQYQNANLFGKKFSLRKNPTKRYLNRYGEVGFWTINREKDLIKFINWDADFITTDDPIRCQLLVKERQ